MANKEFGLAILVISLMSQNIVGVDEPACVSRFDYDFKMMNKIIELEKRQKDLEASLDEQKSIVKELSFERTNHGSTFTIWGKKTCPGNETSLVYSDPDETAPAGAVSSGSSLFTGYMAGAHHGNGGSGSNYLCLTASPLWDHYDEQTGSGGKIYGTEYQFWDHRSTGASNFFGQNVYNKNAPCAVCHITRGTSFMIPGRNECFGGWTKQYSGYLVCGYHTHKQASEYICLDAKIDFLEANETNDDENILHFVESVCGKSLPCPPYVTGRELTCVVYSL